MVVDGNEGMYSQYHVNYENEIDFFIELGNQIQISTGQILGNLGILLLNQSYHHIKIILTIS